MKNLYKYSGKKITAILAHPDDETFGMGGTLAHYASHGAEITLICTTRGEAGDVAPEFLDGYESIAELRMAELGCAAKTLGIKQHFYLAYRDSGMSGSESNAHPEALMNIPIDQVARDLTHLLRKLRPDIVLTHDPFGNYYHPDHIATHQATALAFFACRDETYSVPDELPPHQVGGLYFYTFHRKRLKWLLWLMPLLGMDPRHYGRNGDINLEQILSVQFPIHVEVDYKGSEELRDKATRCHASQGGASRDMTWFGRLRRWLGSSKDAFTQGYPVPENGKIKTILFDFD